MHGVDQFSTEPLAQAALDRPRQHHYPSKAWYLILPVLLLLAVAGLFYLFQADASDAAAAVPSSELLLGLRALGVAIVFATLLGGYFLVLHAWLRSRGELGSAMARAQFEAREVQAWVHQERERRDLNRH